MRRRTTSRRSIRSKHTNFKRAKHEIADKQESWRAGKSNLSFKRNNEK